MRDAGEDVMCVSLQRTSGCSKKTCPSRCDRGSGAGGKEGIPDSAEQRFAPKGESSPPTPSPWPSPIGTAEPDRTGAKANLERFVCLLLVLLNVRLSLGFGWGREPL